MAVRRLHPLITVKLVFRNHSQRGKRVVIHDTEFLIGRQVDCQLRLPGKEVSRHHCSLLTEGNRVAVCDLNSRHGTYVNGKRLAARERMTVGHRDKVQVGSWKFRVSVRDTATKQPIFREFSDDESTANPYGDPGKESGSTASSLLEELDAIASQVMSDGPHPTASRTSHGESTSKPIASPSTNLMPSSAECLDEEASPAKETLSVKNVPTSSDTKSSVEAKPLDSNSAIKRHATNSDHPPTDAQDKDSDSKRLPAHLRPKEPDNPTDAASLALKRIFER